MRIVTIITGKQLGGSKQAFLDHSCLLSEAGFEVTPIIRKGSSLGSYIKSLGGPLADRLRQLRFWRGSFPWVRAHAIRVIKKNMEAIKPDLIMSHRHADLDLLKEACPDIPLLAVAHGFNDASMEYADYILPVSEAVKAYLEKCGVTVPMEVIPNIIRVADQLPYRRPGSPITLGCLAVFRRKKNIELLIDVCRYLKDEGRDVRCFVAGKGHRRLWLRYLIWRRGVAKQMTLLPWVDDKDAFFEMLDVYCVSSRTETFNISLLEAMSRSVPVLSTHCGGPAEIINSEAVGKLVPRNDVEAFSKAIEVIVDNPEKTEKVVRAAYQRVKEVYDYDAVRPALESVCHSFLVK